MILAVPVVSAPAVTPRPVVPHVTALSVAPSPATAGVVADTGPRRTKSFTVVGATWRRGTLAADTRVEVRTRSHGKWSPWTTVGAPDGGPDDGSVDARAAAARPTTASEPLLVGDADGVQARVVDEGPRKVAAPADLHVVMVDGGSSAADRSPGPAHPLGGAMAAAASAQPLIYTRAQWGADEKLRTSNPGCGQVSYGSTITMGFIHHTDGANGYTESQVPAILRSIYAYHVQSNGWCDIGYNFLVDRFGRIWEGRYGGIDRPVIGAHTGGFNTNTFGASLIGTFSSAKPPAAMLAAVEELFAWKLGSYYLDPRTKTTVTAGSFSGSRYATGSKVTFNVVSGHRDADQTSCPGNGAYADLPAVRTAATQLIGAGFVRPTVSPASVRMLSGQSFAIRSGVLDPQSWTLTVADSNGTTVKTVTGSVADATSGLSTSWDLTNLDGTPVPPGSYTVTLTGADAAGATAVPFTRTVTVAPPVTLTVPPTSTYGGTVPVTGVTAPGASVQLSVQRNAEPATSRVVTAGSDGAWSTSVTADGDYTFTASVTASGQTWTSPQATVKVAPEVTSPAFAAGRTLFVAAGGGLALSGTGLPGSAVQLGSSGATVPVRADGTWSGLTVTPSAATTTVVQRSADTASAPFTVYPVSQPTASAPSSGFSRRAFALTGNAGGAPVTVQLMLRPPGASTDSVVATTTAAGSGAYSLTATLPAVTAATSVPWRVVTSVAGQQFGSVAGTVSVQPVFAPTATGRSAGYYGYQIPVSGTAVPGDTVTLWVRAVGATSWTKAASVVSDAANGAFATSFRLVRDSEWRVTSPSGSSAVGKVIVRPSVRTPRTAKAGAMVYAWGNAIPGQKVAVYRRPIGTSPWRYVGSVTTASNGRWNGHWHLVYPMNVRVVSHGQASPVATVRTS